MPTGPIQGKIANEILARLSRADFRLLEPHLEHVELPLRRRLEARNRRIDHVYFIESGFASVVANGSGRPTEVGMIGREGMSGLPVVMGTDRSPHETFMQAGGDGWCMRASNLRLRMQDSATMRMVFLQYAHVFSVQAAQTAFANGRGKIEERLARWLLMAHDRLLQKELPLTHEFLSMMLSVRRAGVTVALHLLQKRGLIQIGRSVIRIVDREGLLATSNGTYGVPEAEYRRVFG
jgi:CRP-like cAMP-binding protein